MPAWPLLRPFLTRHWAKIGLAVAVLGLFAAFGWAWNGWSAEKALRQADRAAYGQAQAEAALLAKRAVDAVEARYRRNADNADRSHTEALADARSLTDAHIARMRTKAAACPAGGAVASAEGDVASVPEPVSTGLVLVDPADVQRAADWQTYGLACRAWALTITE
jgi:hypothetical protein